ncbi:hypothetical protein VOLCADRAFT_98978 [Volvox carteri f. nagariensis]|uniref:Protein kinase domain-containing protein n=1 Tax=Volvox carteri f. nagariensis TaxID=3068 RepID=D8UGR3_VOLCA|nr:uncharacterized protein VOLCADRAFT_98978 [Volvox carteri f. nagariensis]EFJ41094.1 hypothetical protein VOLCADRAFT_98978 [Volvox carteri f. nagariensis]|eukprot:XP_002957857.1 hypothetical protein VOLCADRAFT_98978 [Volvox carteri f. nagariensis]
MGLAQSCLKAPKAEDFEVIVAPVKARAEAVCTLSGHQNDVGDVTIVPVFKGRDEVTCIDTACDVQSIPTPGTCLIPASVGDVHDPVNETVQASDALTATATTCSLPTTFMSSEGYPLSWEFGPPSTDDEPSRIQALRALDILDTVSHGRGMRIDEEADMVLGALMQMFSAITAMLVLFDDTRIIIRNAKGCMKPGEFPYRWSFCAYTLTKHRPQTLVVPDATKDVRFADNPFVRGAPHVRFYCGAPLVSTSGHILGTVCFADDKPRSDFDVSHCYVMNNLAELLVRQLERYRANAGPAGPDDAETTALARVARTIECYDTVTGLVDISLPDGWMLMYVNEAWEVLCSPWTRKQLVGRPLQRLLLLEEGDEEGARNKPPSWQPAAHAAAAAPITAAAGQPMGAAATAACSADDRDMQVGPMTGHAQLQGQGIQAAISGCKAEETGAQGVMVHGSSSTHTSGSCCTNRYPSATSSSGGEMQGILMRGDESMDVPAAERRQWRQQQVDQSAAWRGGAWQRHAEALRTGKEVELGRARVLLEDGRPSTMVMHVTARSANCHVLDAAVRMPVGVPHHMALPPSILVAGNQHATDPASTCDEGQGKAQMAEATGKSSAVDSADGMTSYEPFYCFVSLRKVDGAAADVEFWENAGVESELGEPHQKVQNLLPAAGSETTHQIAACNTGPGRTGEGSRALLHEPVVPSTPSPSTCLHPAGAAAPLSPPAMLPSPMAQSVSYCGWPSLDNGTRGPVSVTASARASMRSCVSQGISNWTYGMEPFLGLKLGHLLGKGGYGRVFMGSYKGQKIAAKVISNAMLKSATCLNGVTLEALLAQEIEHPYIVRTYKCIVRSYKPDKQHSTACMSVRNSGQNAAFYTAPSERGGSCSMVSHRSTVPPPTSSAVSVLPSGPSDGVDGPRTRPTPGRPSEAGPCSPDTMDPAGMGQRSKSVVAAAGTASATAASTVGPTAAGPVAPAVQIAAAAPAPAAQAAMQDEDYDSFDAGGAEDAGGMIDQLVSGGPAVHVPQSAASHAGFPSAASHAPAPHLTAIPDRLMLAAGSCATVQSGVMTQGSTSNANSNVDQMVAMFAAPGREAPRVPPGVTSPADLFGTATEVFSTAAATAAAAAAAAATASAAGASAADASLRLNSRMPNDALSEGETWIIQEFCGGGTLQDAIDSGRLRTEPSRLTGKPHMPYILLTAQEIASAMACVHSRGYLHGDLSAVNVLLTEAPGGLPSGATGRGWIAKVSDFGLAKTLPDPAQPCISSAYGVITHCAPEVLKSHIQTQKADCYSFGVLLWQMFTGSRPWANMNRFQILGAVTGAAAAGLRFLPTHQPPPPYHDLTMRCLSQDPAARPTFAEICEELRLMTYDAACAGELSG